MARPESEGLIARERVAHECELRGLTVKREVPVPPKLWRSRAGRCDLEVVGLPDYPDGLLVEVKHQTSTGTADEKVVFAVEAAKRYPKPTVLVLSGKPLLPAAEWFENAAQGSLVAVMTFDDWVDWLR